MNATRYRRIPELSEVAFSVSRVFASSGLFYDLIGMEGAIAELDRPFASIIGLQPRAMERVLTSVVQSSSQSPAAFRPFTAP